MIKYIITTLTGLILATGCSRQEESATGFTPAYIRIAPSITRVTGVNFDAGDQIGLTITKAGTLYCENSPLRYDGSVFASEDLLWYNNLNEKSTLTAYYPYTAAGNPSRFNVHADQRLTADHSASDLLAATAENVSPSESAVNMTFFHLLTKLVIEITNNSDSAIKQVVIQGTRGTALVNLPTKSAKVDATSAEIVVYPFPTATTGEYVAILVPQTAALLLEIETVDGKRRTKKFQSVDLETGSLYTIEATISNIDIHASISGAIQDWDDAGVIPPEGDSTEDPTELTYQGAKYRIAQFSDGSTWLAENLRYVPQGKTASISPAQDSGIWYPCTTTLTASSDEAYIRQQGLLYNLETAVDQTITAENFRQIEGARGICPEGWHIPTEGDLNALISLIQGGEADKSFLTFAGIRDLNGQYFGQILSELFSKGYFICSTPESESFSPDGMTYKYCCFMRNNALLLSGMDIRNGAPIRCIKDKK